MLKKFIIHFLAITGFSMLVRDLLTVVTVKYFNKSTFANFYLIGTLMRTYADVDFIESGMSEEDIESVKETYHDFKDLK